MENTTREISNICRFCLCENDLLPVSNVASSLLTIEEIEYFTGIQITEEEQRSFATCETCCGAIKKAARFRASCLKNDHEFRELFSVLVESVLQVKDYTWDVTYGDEVVEEGPMIEPHETSLITVQLTDDNISQFPSRNLISANTSQKTNFSQSDDDSEWEYKRHIKQLCPICGKMVTNVGLHISSIHDKVKKYSCPHCPLAMALKGNLSRHINEVHKKKIIKTCEQCGRGFCNKNSYLSHMTSIHGTGERYKCQICSKSFSLLSSCKQHMRSWHLNQKEFKCTTCSSTFKLRTQLTNHQKVHSDEHPFACSICPKRFKSGTAKKNHEIAHSGFRFSCELCTKSYRYKCLLNMHYRKDHEGMIPSKMNNDSNIAEFESVSSSKDN
ncbi:zinc finger protein 227-like isoform X1 [Anopheles ziemanni]|uniref:zinc finger protein 227-like isoform X1 n=1 Tax=Anopheles coustani TaxID=139045 RepID=UPI00265B0F73|nr:zinc finger protein 227-like isoform X1 [Anopheles coustani]XP_058172983.1 zinc finger protein 227-like isoform X1 [Anopheles ziemanni]